MDVQMWLFYRRTNIVVLWTYKYRGSIDVQMWWFYRRTNIVVLWTYKCGGSIDVQISWFYRRTDETEHKLRPKELSSAKD